MFPARQGAVLLWRDTVKVDTDRLATLVARAMCQRVCPDKARPHEVELDTDVLDSMARDHGYRSWVHCYHRMPGVQKRCHDTED